MSTNSIARLTWRDRFNFWRRNSVFLDGKEWYVARNAKLIVKSYQRDKNSTLSSLKSKIERLQSTQRKVLTILIPLQMYLICYVFDVSVEIPIQGIEVKNIGPFNDIVFLISIMISTVSNVMQIHLEVSKESLKFIRSYLVKENERFIFDVDNQDGVDILSSYLNVGGFRVFYISFQRQALTWLLFSIMVMAFLFVVLAVIFTINIIVAYNLLIESNFGHGFSNVVFYMSVIAIVMNGYLYLLYNCPLPYTTMILWEFMPWIGEFDRKLYIKIISRRRFLRKREFFDIIFAVCKSQLDNRISVYRTLKIYST